MNKLFRFYQKITHPRRHITLQQALLGANIAYLAYRFRYFFQNNIVSTILHLCEFILLGLFFNTQQFFTLILLRASTIIIKNGWWGALEGLREKMRRYKRATDNTKMACELTCWFYLSIIISAIILIIGGIIFISRPNILSERSLWYSFAMILQLTTDLMVRVIHSGIFATQRIYRPMWSIFFAEIISFAAILILYPIARSWCLPVSYILMASISLFLTMHYSRAAYRLHSRTILIKLSWHTWINWYNTLPLKKIMLAACASAAMSLEGLLLWLAFPFANKNPELFKLLYLLSPQFSAGFSWTRMCYFDFKKLCAPKWQVFLPRFSRYFSKFSILVGTLCWLMSLITCELFLPTTSFTTLLWFLPLFICCSLISLRQIKLFSSNHYKDILAVTFLWSTKPRLSATPLFSSTQYMSIYQQLDVLQGYTQKIILIYFEIAPCLDLQHKKLILDRVGAALSNDTISAVGEAHFLCYTTSLPVLEKIHTILLGNTSFYYTSQWENNGRTALQKAYVLKTRILPIHSHKNRGWSLHMLENQLKRDFPDAISVDLTQDMGLYFKKMRKSKEKCRDIINAIQRTWCPSPSFAPPRPHAFTALCYSTQDVKHLFIVPTSFKTRSKIHYWQRQLWQFTLAQHQKNPS